MPRAATAVILGLSLLFAGCHKESETKSGGHAGGGKAEGVFSGLTLDDAKAKAQAENKLVMIDFYADWCGPCKALDSTTWPDPKVVDWLKQNAIAIKLNVDEHRPIAQKFNVRAIPLIVILDGSGKELARDNINSPADFMALAAKAKKQPPWPSAVPPGGGTVP